MRIGIVTYDYDPPIGGLGVIAKQVKTTLEKLHPEDAYVILSPSKHTDDNVSRIAARRWKRAGGCPLFSLILFCRLQQVIRKHKLELLHVHAGSGGVFLLRKPSIPVVVTSHHTYLQEAEVVFRKYPVKRLWKRFMALLEKRTYTIADAIVCVSQDTADVLREQYGVPSKKLSVIENAVPEIAELPPVKKDPNTILFIGRLEERKGIWTLLEAMKLLHETHPHVKLRLIGSNLIGDRIHTFIKKNNLQDSVALLGFVDDPFMQRELLNASILVVPSLLEGFGLVAASALMSGTCVVASDAHGLRSIIRNNETGLLFRSGDVHECARALASVLENPGLAEKLAREGRTDALKRFSFVERASDLHDIFTTVQDKK